jgi:hypothetical protein
MPTGRRSDIPRDAGRLLRLYGAAPRIPTTEHLEERSILLALLCGRLAETEAPIDWEALLHLAERFAMMGLVGSNIDRGVVAFAPDPVRARIADRAEQLRIENRLLLRDVVALETELGAAGIDHVFLKGAALLVRRPQAIPIRQTSDIDLLVRRQDLAVLKALLSQRGHVLEDRPRHPYHPVVATSRSATLCEIHVALEPDLLASTWSRAERVQFEGVAISVPSSADLAAHLCHHVLVQHDDTPNYLPRHLRDLDFVLSPEIAPKDLTRATRDSIELRDLVHAWADHPILCKIAAALVFPRRHSVVPLALADRLRGGYRGVRGELTALRRIGVRALFDVS